MPTNPTLLRAARLFHLYSGVFIAPALLFFAVTGAVQTFSLHETTRGSNYKPPAILVKLGQLHKKQTILVAVRPPRPEPTPPPVTAAPSIHEINPDHLGIHTNQQKHDRLAGEPTPPPQPPNPIPATPAPAPPAPRPQHLLPMKIFFLIVSVGLVLSTLTGLYMAYKYARRALPITLTLLAGTAVPILLLLLE